jgi:hypothetical protein
MKVLANVLKNKLLNVHKKVFHDNIVTQRFSNWGLRPYLGSPNFIQGSPKSTSIVLLS